MNLLGIMLIIFYIIPTLIIQRNIMMDDGKGLANMIFLYLVGGWIRKYENEIISDKKVLGGVFLSTLAVEFVLNSVLSWLKGGHGIYAPFARDCSVFILIMAITVFLIFKDIAFKNKTINMLANGVLATYIFEGILRDRFLLENVTIALSKKGEFIGYVVLLALILFFVVEIIEVIRKKTVDRVFSKIYDVFEIKLFKIRTKQ